MTKLPPYQGELFERDPKTGKKADAKIWAEMLKPAATVKGGKA